MNIDIKLDNALVKKVESFSSEMKIARNDFIAKAVKKYVHLQEMSRIRKELKGVARKSGFKSEKEIFERIS